MEAPQQENRLQQATEVAIRLAVLALLLGWCAVILMPFLLPIAWGAIIAVALHGTHNALATTLGGRRRLAAMLVSVALLGAIIVPAVLLGSSLVEEVQALVVAHQQGRMKVPEPSAKVATWPLIGQQVHDFWLLASQNLDAAVSRFEPYMKSALSWLLGAAASFGVALLEAVFAIIIAGVMLATAGSGAAGAHALAGRLGGERARELVGLSVAAIRGVTRGILGVALIQSLLAGLGLLVAGVPAAGVLTFVMLVLCVVQVGVGLVMVPTAIWLFANADTGPAVAFLVWTVLVLPLDNILKPLLMGRGLHVPILVIFLGAIGGFLTQGIIGLFVGAVVLVVGYELLLLWIHQPTASAEPAPAGAADAS